jgi:hypothetical protein
MENLRQNVRRTRGKLCKATARVSFAAVMLSVQGVRLRFSQQNLSRSLRFAELPLIEAYHKGLVNHATQHHLIGNICNIGLLQKR